ncbi:MAG: hypothetical protein CL677_07080 [Bdellovibrionaceae bacterium]|nr:hypothetical protein [Pseudobdellovibrionaceae bacterium]|tara:strand:+ start:499 stop:954 length:456 start_codon:yes stop_codon:yes gene_type:complete
MFKVLMIAVFIATPILTEISLSHAKVVTPFRYGPYKISVATNENPEPLTMGGNPLLRITPSKSSTKQPDLLISYKESPPQSIKTIHNVLKRLKGDPKSLKFKRFGNSALFYFRNSEAAHIFSTKGGMIMAMGPSQSLGFKQLVGRRVVMVQ